MKVLTIIALFGLASVSPAAKVTPKLAGFTGINAYGPFLITIYKGKTDSVQLEGDAKLLNGVNTTIDAYKTLKIRLADTAQVKPKQVVKINITAVEFHNVNLGGDTKVNVKSPIQTGSFRILGTDNSSLINLDVGATTVNVVLSGSATVNSTIHATVFQAVLSANTIFNASGSADVVTVEIGGTSSFYGSKLKGGFVTGSIRRKGKGEFNSNNEMKVAVYEQGTVKTSGAGDLTKSIYGDAKWSRGGT